MSTPPNNLAKKLLKLKKKIVKPDDPDQPDATPAPAEMKSMKGLLRNLQKNDPGGDLDLTPKKPLDLKKKTPGGFDSITKGGITPLGREAKDSLQKNGVGSALRTVARGVKNEVKGSFGMDTTKKEDKLKRMSSDITRGTRAANPNPFTKK